MPPPLPPPPPPPPRPSSGSGSAPLRSAPTRSAMPPRRAPAPRAQLLPAPALLLLLLLLLRGDCLASPVPAVPLPVPGPCAAQPCRNGGVCTPRPAPGPQSPAPAGETSYICTCPAGVSGTNCQVSERGGSGAGRRPGTRSRSSPAASGAPRRASASRTLVFPAWGRGWIGLSVCIDADPLVDLASATSLPTGFSGRAILGRSGRAAPAPAATLAQHSCYGHWSPSGAPLRARAEPLSAGVCLGAGGGRSEDPAPIVPGGESKVQVTPALCPARPRVCLGRGVWEAGDGGLRARWSALSPPPLKVLTCSQRSQRAAASPRPATSPS